MTLDSLSFSAAAGGVGCTRTVSERQAALSPNTPMLVSKRPPRSLLSCSRVPSWSFEQNEQPFGFASSSPSFLPPLDSVPPNVFCPSPPPSLPPGIQLFYDPTLCRTYNGWRDIRVWSARSYHKSNNRPHHRRQVTVRWELTFNSSICCHCYFLLPDSLSGLIVSDLTSRFASLCEAKFLADMKLRDSFADSVWLSARKAFYLSFEIFFSNDMELL